MQRLQRRHHKPHQQQRQRQHQGQPHPNRLLLQAQPYGQSVVVSRCVLQHRSVLSAHVSNTASCRQQRSALPAWLYRAEYNRRDH